MVFLLLISSGSFLFAQKAQAGTTYGSDGIEFELSVSDNFFRTYKGGALNFSASLKLIKPDTLDMGYLSGDNFGPYGINGVNIGLAGASQQNSKCRFANSILGSQFSNMYVCDFPYISNSEVSRREIKKGDVLNFAISLTATDITNLGIDAASDAGTLNQVLVFPYLSLNSTNDVTFSRGAKTVYVQVFNTAAQLQQNQNSPRPAGVPPNGSLVSSPDGSGGGVLGLINKIIGALIGLLQEFIYLIFYWLIAPIIQSILSIRTYTDTFAAVIYPGWEVVRNLCNIFFIVALIAIAMATLLRVESYKYKDLLVKLILAALLVNFSLVIAQAILGVADTIQNQFLPNNVEVIRSLAKDLMVSYRSDIYGNLTNVGSQGYFALTVQPLFKLVLSLGSFLVFLAIGAFLVIRMVMLWVLLMLSPIPYVADILPATEKFKSEWWSNFLKYAFFAPIMGLFLNMAAVISNSAKTNPVLKQVLVDPSILGNDNLSSFVFSVGSNILLLVFLVAGLKVAESSSTIGAKAITDIAQKGMFAPFALAGLGAKKGAGAIGQAYSKWTTKNLTAADKSGKKGRANLWRAAQFLNPVVAKKAWEARAHEKEEEAYMPATGHMRDTINRVLPTEWDWKGGIPRHLGKRSYYGRVGQQQLIYKKEKEYENADLSEEEKVEAYLGARHPEDKEGIRRLLIKGRHEDGLQILQGLDKRAKKANELTEQYIAEGLDKDSARARANSEVTNPDSKNYVAAQYDSVEDLYSAVADFEHAGYTPEQIGEILAHLDELGEADTKLRAIGNAVYEFDGKFRSASEFGGYGKLEQAKGKTAVLNELEQTGIFDIEKNADGSNKTDDKGNFVFAGRKETIKDADGNNVEVRRSVLFNGQEITGFEDLQKVVKNTAKVSKKEGKNLKYELTGARKQLSAQKRVERGDSEKWGAALEPAAFLVQDADGEFKEFTSYGRRLFQKYSPANVNAFRRSRRLQARIIKAAGLYKDEKSGKLEINKITDDKLALMAEGFKLNEDLEDAIIERAELQPHELLQVKEKLNAFVQANKAKYGDFQLEEYVNQATQKGSIRIKRKKPSP